MTVGPRCLLPALCLLDAVAPTVAGETRDHPKAERPVQEAHLTARRGMRREA